MKLRLLNLLTALSLLLTGAVVLGWILGVQLVSSDGGRLWWVMFSKYGVYTMAVEQWPGTERTRWITDDSIYSIPTVAFSGPEWGWQRFGVGVEDSVVTTVLDEAGKSVSLGESHHYDWTVASPRLRHSTPMRLRSLRVPYWMLLVIGGAVPLARLGLVARRFVSRRRRAARGLCVRCGYDLRGTPGHCPECGTTAFAGPTP